MNLDLSALAMLAEGRSGRVVERRPAVKRLADVEPEKVRWLWNPYIPLGKLTILEGDPGVGKTWLSLRLAAAVSRGEPLPGRDGVPREWREPANVLYLTAEDGLADTLRPRLDAAGADPERVFALAGWQGRDDEGRERTGAVTLQDVDILAAAIAEHRPALVVVDPVQGFIGAGVDVHRANEVRAVLAGLAQLAEEHQCAVLLVRHLAKASTDRAIYRGLGSIDFAAAARSILLVGQDPDDETGARRVVAHVKSSLAERGPSLAFSIREGAFYWEGVAEADAEALLAPRATGEGGKLAVDEAKEFLRELLADGPVPAKEVENAYRAAGFSRSTIFRAKFALGIRVEKTGRTWQWVLPTEHLEHMEQLEQLNEQRGSGAASSSVPSVPTVPTPNGMRHLDAGADDDGEFEEGAIPL